MLHHWCRKRGCKRTPKSFDLVKIREKSLKIREKFVEIWTKSLKAFTKSLKMWANPSWKDEQNGAQNNMKSFFWRSLSFMDFFSGKFGRIRAKILRPPKNWPASTPMCCITTDSGIFWYCSRNFWSCICESPGRACNGLSKRSRENTLNVAHAPFLVVMGQLT